VELFFCVQLLCIHFLYNFCVQLLYTTFVCLCVWVFIQLLCITFVYNFCVQLLCITFGLDFSVGPPCVSFSQLILPPGITPGSFRSRAARGAYALGREVAVFAVWHFKCGKPFFACF
jgi:hypothetical protein